jgi:hypothetical protein
VVRDEGGSAPQFRLTSAPGVGTSHPTPDFSAYRFERSAWGRPDHKPSVKHQLDSGVEASGPKQLPRSDVILTRRSEHLHWCSPSLAA